MSYFNMIQLVESSGIGLVYGLRFYSKGQLDDLDIVSYVKTNALLYEYYKQAYEQMPADIGDELVKLFNSEQLRNKPHCESTITLEKVDLHLSS